MKKHTSVDNLFGCLYQPDLRDLSAFSGHYTHPGVFEYGVPQLVARYEKDSEDGDGQPVEVWETRLPARFFDIRVQPGRSSNNTLQAGYTLSTGTGMEKWAAQTAELISQGMLGIDSYAGFNPEAIGELVEAAEALVAAVPNTIPGDMIFRPVEALRNALVNLKRQPS